MAAITSAVIIAGSAAYSANQQRSAARDAARRQSQGVEQAQSETRAATNRARDILTGVAPPPEQMSVEAGNRERENQRAELQDQLNRLESHRPSSRGRLRHEGQIEQLRSQLEEFDRETARLQSQAVENLAGQVARQQQPTADSSEALIEGDPAVIQPDPRSELLSGIFGQLAFTDRGFGQAQETISPLAAMAAPYLQQQANILGLGGEDARQQAISQISDPLAAAQERALLRNNAALGGVGGNVLSDLAEQTRSRTEANIGNRLAQLGRASSPALNALQNISNLRLNQGLSMADIVGVGARDLSAQETARRQALANLELGQGSALSQLAQNLGTARAGGSAFAAQSPSPLSAGLTAGLGAYTGAGGTFGGFGNNANTAMNVQNPNRFGNIA